MRRPTGHDRAAARVQAHVCAHAHSRTPAAADDAWYTHACCAAIGHCPSAPMPLRMRTRICASRRRPYGRYVTPARYSAARDSTRAQLRLRAQLHRLRPSMPAINMHARWHVRLLPTHLRGQPAVAARTCTHTHTYARARRSQREPGAPYAEACVERRGCGARAARYDLFMCASQIKGFLFACLLLCLEQKLVVWYVIRNYGNGRAHAHTLELTRARDNQRGS